MKLIVLIAFRAWQLVMVIWQAFLVVAEARMMPSSWMLFLVFGERG